MQVHKTKLDGVLIIEPDVHGDARGFFKEVYRESVYRAAGIDARFVQGNHSRSCRNTVRGLHYQLEHPQAKLCHVFSGCVRDVVLDIRRGSPTFGQWVQCELSSDNHRQIFVPQGFAHGFAVLSETADFIYKCDGEYDPSDEYGVAWNDPALKIDWGVDNPLISPRDATSPALSDVPDEHLPTL